MAVARISRPSGSCPKASRQIERGKAASKRTLAHAFASSLQVSVLLSVVTKQGKIRVYTEWHHAHRRRCRQKVSVQSSKPCYHQRSWFREGVSHLAPVAMLLRKQAGPNPRLFPE